jgi:hypothetical protein
MCDPDPVLASYSCFLLLMCDPVLASYCTDEEGGEMDGG